MPHPTPTTAPKEPPLPLREGRGTATTMGVGGLALAVLAALTFLTPPAAAQIIPTGTPAADILLSQALTEHRVFLTCSVLDAQVHPVILQNWQADVDAAVQTLTAAAVPPEAVAAFTTAARPENLLPAPDALFQDVQALCAAHPGWQEDYARLTFTVLALKLPRALE